MLCPWDVGSVASFAFASRPARKSLTLLGSSPCQQQQTSAANGSASGSNGHAPDASGRTNGSQAQVAVYLSHRHNITIAINDEPIDKIQMKCRSPSCYQHAHSRFRVSSCSSPASTFKFNMVAMCVGYTALFSSFRALQNLFTSLYSPVLGAAALACVYLAASLSCTVLQPAVYAIGTKRSILLGFGCCMLWMAANFHPQPYLLLPASALAGLGYSLTCSAQDVYASSLSEVYRSSVKAPVHVGRYNAVLLALFHTAHVWGNAIGSLIFKYFRPLGLASLNELQPFLSNATVVNDTTVATNVSDQRQCGTLDCPESLFFRSGRSVAFAASTRNDAVSLVVLVLLILSGLGFLAICLFLQNVNTQRKRVRLRDSSTFVKSSFRQLCDPFFRLLIPMLITIGFEQGFIYADYTRWFVACASEVDSIGVHMMVLGLAHVLGSAVTGLLVRCCQRALVMAASSLLHLALLLVVLLLNTPCERSWIMFLVSASWGLCGAAWQTQCNILLASERSEAEYRLAFANFRFLQCCGMLLAFALSGVLCNYLKLCLLIAMLVLTVTCYFALELRLRRCSSSAVAAAADAKNYADDAGDADDARNDAGDAGGARNDAGDADDARNDAGDTGDAEEARNDTEHTKRANRVKEERRKRNECKNSSSRNRNSKNKEKNSV